MDIVSINNADTIPTKKLNYRTKMDINPHFSDIIHTKWKYGPFWVDFIPEKVDLIHYNLDIILNKVDLIPTKLVIIPSHCEK